jgi:uracil-DNA glycosylase family 4
VTKPDRCAESGCALAKSGAGFVPPEIGARYESTRYLLIGESPGEAEARDSLPFRPYAQSGSLLADAMREVNISRSEVAIYNILACRPPKDYLEGAPYAFNAISHCTENYLRGVIHDLQPNAILALGGTAYRTLTAAPRGRYGTLDYARGYVVPGAGVAEGVPVLATYHPAFLRRGAAHLTPLLHRDLRRGFLLATGKLVEGRHFSTRLTDLGLRYQTAPTLGEAWDYANGIDPDLPLAFDIETPMSTRSDEDERTSFTDRDIKLFQCTQQRGGGIAIPFRDEFRDVVRRILERCPCKVGFNNWNFDDPVLAANGIDVGVTDDAMVMFGTMYSDLPKNLQSAAQMAGFTFPWKAISETDLAWYGCADADATLAVYEYMVKVLSGERIGDAA